MNTSTTQYNVDLTADGLKKLQGAQDEMKQHALPFPNRLTFPNLMEGYGKNFGKSQMQILTMSDEAEFERFKTLLRFPIRDLLTILPLTVAPIRDGKVMVEVKEIDGDVFWVKFYPKERNNVRTTETILEYFALGEVQKNNPKVAAKLWDEIATALSAKMKSGDVAEYIGLVKTPSGYVAYTAPDTPTTQPEVYYWLARLQDWANLPEDMRKLFATELNAVKSSKGNAAPEEAKTEES